MTLYNFALAANGATATATASDGGFPPTQAIDGSDVTMWHSNMNSSGKTITVDLGAPQYITSADCLAYRSSGVVGTWHLEYSGDNVNWNIVRSDIPNTGQTYNSTGGITARYWRLRVNSNYWNATTAGFYTIALMGPVEAPPPPTSPAPDYIEAWLDGIEANYVPTVEDWLAAN